jgi:RNA polymerase sigma-70 factor, ECF subfamily
MALAEGEFERTVMNLLPRLLGVARRLTHNDADAEDLVAETVARAWRARETLACEAARRAWLFRILHNTFVSGYRHARTQPVCEELEPDSEADTARFSLFEQIHQPFLLWFGNPEQAFLDKLLREDIERALAALPLAYRLVVVLADVEEFSYAEIGEMLEVPVGTVRSRLARARAALQRMLWRQAQACGLHGEAVARAAGAAPLATRGKGRAGPLPQTPTEDGS